VLGEGWGETEEEEEEARGEGTRKGVVGGPREMPAAALLPCRRSVPTCAPNLKQRKFLNAPVGVFKDV